jgi:predicted GNAT family acetyltransferase
MQRNETPFLHVMSDNHSAHELYLRMGFRDYQESIVRVVSLVPARVVVAGMPSFTI